MRSSSVTFLLLAAIGGAVAVSLCVGCRATGPVKGTPATPPQLEDKVVAKDKAIRYWLRVVQHTAVRTADGRLKVKLAFDNLRNKNMWCDIQVVFYDEDGFELENTTWQPLMVTREQVTYFSTTSLGPNAHDYSVLLGNPRKNDDLD